MPKPENFEDMDCDSLQVYCPYIRHGGKPGVHGGPNGPYSCEGRYCEEAYENYLEEFEEE
jgi:hypothetical protein